MRRVKGKPPGNFATDFIQAIRYMMTHRRVLQIILLMLLFWGCGTVILNGLTGIITNPLYFGLPNDWVGYFLGIVGIGMIAGAASASLAQTGIPKEIGIGWAMVLTGVFLLAFSLVRTWWRLGADFFVYRRQVSGRCCW